MKIELKDKQFDINAQPQKSEGRLTISIGSTADIDDVRKAFSDQEQIDALKCNGEVYEGYSFDHIDVTSDSASVVLNLMSVEEQLNRLRAKVRTYADTVAEAFADLSGGESNERADQN